MSDEQPRVALFCPGRGSYTAESMGKLRSSLAYVQRAEELRKRYELMSLIELDRAVGFVPEVHLDPRNVSALIWLHSMIDAERVRDKAEVVCVGGNSLGWYTALAASGALSFDDGFLLMQAMSILQAEHTASSGGGQLIYPVIDEEWRPNKNAKELVRLALATSNGQAFESIHLGGYIVLAGSEEGLLHLEASLPAVHFNQNEFPFRLVQHGPYHTPLSQSVADQAHEALPDINFRRPKITLIDGRGRRFTPWSTDPQELAEYTFGPQVTEPYDFSRSVATALGEYAPDRVALAGPGNTLGGVVGQVVCQMHWKNIHTKFEFQAHNDCAEPFIWSMG